MCLGVLVAVLAMSAVPGADESKRPTGVFSGLKVGQSVTPKEVARRLGLEGIVSKRADGRHWPDRSADWLKVKCTRRENFVIIGYLNP
jgi:bifunctional non-homologous end joining protein LigD